MATIQEIKRQYPAYANIPDAELADRLYAKHYAGKIDRAEFDKRVGIAPQESGSLAQFGKSLIPGSGIARALDKGVDTNAAAAASEAVQSGATLGFGDEIQAGLGAVGAKLLGGEATEDQTLKELYRMGLESARGRQNELKEAYPKTSFVGELAGGLATGGGIAKAASMPFGAKSAVLGSAALTGGVAGVGYGEQETPIDYAKDFGVGAAQGAVIGGAIQSAPWLAEKFKGFAENAPAKLRNYMAGLSGVNPQLVKDFTEAGVPASLATVSDKKGIALLDRALHKFPLSADMIAASAKRTFEGIEQAVSKAVPGTHVDPITAGQILQKGIGSYIDKFHNLADDMYSNLGKHVGYGDKVAPQSTVALLAQIKNRFKETPQLQGIINSVPAVRLAGGVASDAAHTKETFKALRASGFEWPAEIIKAMDIADDAQRGVMPYKALKQYRSEIGALIKENVVSGKDNALAKEIYGALSSDMEAAFAAKGESALRDFRRVNAFYREGIDNIEKTLVKLKNERVPERVYGILAASSRFGGSKMNSIMKTLSAEEKDVLRKTFLHDIGNESGKFNPNQFFNTLDKRLENAPEAMGALFGGQSSEYLRGLRKISKVYRRVQDLEKMSNFSNTAAVTSVGSLMTGLFFAPVSTIATAALTRGAASLLTNEAFVKKLAQWSQAKATPNNISKFIGSMQKIASDNPAIASDIQKRVAYLGALVAARTARGENE